MNNKQLRIHCSELMEGQIKALLNEIQKKRKEQGIRPNTQADVLLESLYHYRKIVDLSTLHVDKCDIPKAISGALDQELKALQELKEGMK